MFKVIKKLTSLVAVLALTFTFTAETMAAKKSKTLKNTQKKGFVRCGVSQGLPGFSNADASGNWTGVDVDVCRAVAAAVLGDANKVKFTPLSAKERFTALTSGEIDKVRLVGPIDPATNLGFSGPFNVYSSAISFATFAEA